MLGMQHLWSDPDGFRIIETLCRRCRIPQSRTVIKLVSPATVVELLHGFVESHAVKRRKILHLHCVASGNPL